MKVLKGCALALLCFILFLFLNIFGLLYSVNQVALNPGVIKGIIQDIDLAELARGTLNQDQSNFTTTEVETQKIMIETLDRLQPLIKEKLDIALDGAYAYLKGKSQTPNLKTVLADSFVNSDFAAKLLAEVDLTHLLDQLLKEQGSPGSDSEIALRQSLLATMQKIEPDFKKQVVAASDPVFKYVLGQTSAIDLKTTARNTLLSNIFMSAVIDNFDLKPITRDMLNDQLGALPQGFILPTGQLDRIMVLLEPELKTSLKTAVGPIADYVVGKSSSFKVTISIKPQLPALKPIIREVFLANLPPELKTAAPTLIDREFENYWNDFQRLTPSNFTLDETMLGADMDASLNQAFSDAESGLSEVRDNLDQAAQEVDTQVHQARTYIAYFHAGFIALIVLLLILLAGVILIQRSVRGASRDLGITFTVYGVLTTAVVIIIRTVIPRILIQNSTDIPQVLSDLIPRITHRLTAPLFAVGLACLIGGVVLVLVSVFYPKPANEESETP